VQVAVDCKTAPYLVDPEVVEREVARSEVVRPQPVAGSVEQRVDQSLVDPSAAVVLRLYMSRRV
jgi:hypothetical protein